MLHSRWILTAAALSSFGAAATMPAVKTSAHSSSVDSAGMDRSVQPGDDFDSYANGGWRRTALIPPDRSSTGVFLRVFEKAEQRNAQLIRELAASHPASGSNAKKIADYYAAYMDEAAIAKNGLGPLKPQLSAIAAIQSREELARVLGSELRADVDPINATHVDTENLFGLFVAQGLEDPAHNVPYLLQGGLGMPNRDYYLAGDKRMVAFRAQYQTYVAALLKQAGQADAETQAEVILALEVKIAQAQTSIVDSEDIHKANNPWALADFAKKAPGLDWKDYFKAAGLERQPLVIVWQPQTVSQVSALVASEPLDAWKSYLAFHVINQSASLLPKSYADLAFGFYGRDLNGTPRQRDRWKRAIGMTNSDLGDAVGQLYVRRYFPASSKAQVQQMVRNILAAFAERVDALDWMTAPTKLKAKAKIASIKVGVGYPETWRDYAGLEIRRDDPVGNHVRAQLHEYRHQLAKLDRPVDRGEWWMTPQMVNAVNLPLQNALNLPAAILEAPFFDPKADAAANYGSIGAAIGHEISHGFDNTGAEFDAEGRLANWWTPEDRAHFKATGQRLVEQYNRYEALPGLHIDGQQTLAENIADLSGLAIAYLAYHKSLAGKPAPVINGMSGDQRFFLAFAQSWREKTREAAMRQQVMTDSHAPGRFRAQTVRNIDAWYDAFTPRSGQKLYLDPSARVKIW